MTEGHIDRLYLVSNEFVNTMTQEPRIMQLLPSKPAAPDQELKHHWDYIYEPDAKEVLDDLLSRYIESLVYQGVVENAACEQASRMVAMKSATDNAGDLIDDCSWCITKLVRQLLLKKFQKLLLVPQRYKANNTGLIAQMY